MMAVEAKWWRGGRTVWELRAGGQYGDLLGRVAAQVWKNRLTGLWRAVWGIRGVFEKHDPPIDRRDDMPSRVTAMSEVEARWQANNPDKVLSVLATVRKVKNDEQRTA